MAPVGIALFTLLLPSMIVSAMYLVEIRAQVMESNGTATALEQGGMAMVAKNSIAARKILRMFCSL
jgi:hypothetical protein